MDQRANLGFWRMVQNLIERIEMATRFSGF
jgi:hypothetical protein